MLGIGLLIVGIILFGVGSQAKRERIEEERIGLPSAKGLSGVPFYVLGVIAIIVGILMLAGIIRLA
ncbi:MAG TPA: hypothetical protein VHN20_05875 [Beijerinckiaceae bacterium]|nr:hypothetical protein [Beijerinckiaceae bacterium]